jgi:outer membrane receptor for ferrienterochelin and colicin
MHVIVNDNKFACVTDKNGFFKIEDLPAGTYTLTLDHIQYKTQIIKNIRIYKDQVLNLEPIKFEYRVIELNGVVVTATRTNHTITEVPNPINLVPESRILKRNAKTSAESLREETGIFVQKTGHGGGSPIIRGLSSNQILILVDGIRLNNSTYRLGNHQYLTTVDNQIAEQIEVVRGPTSMLYGSDALGGTINVITKKPQIQNQPFHINYRLLGRFATADLEKTTRTELSLHHRSFALLAGFSYKDYEDLRRGNNSNNMKLENSTNGLKQSPTGFTSYNFDAKLACKLTSSQTLILAHQITRKQNVPRYDKYENDGYNRWFYHPQNRDLIYVIYENKFNRKFLASMRTSFSFHRQVEGREIQKYSSSPLIVENDDVKTIGLTIQLHSLISRHFLTYGTDLYMDRVSSERFSTSQETGQTEKELRGRYPNGARYNSFGCFLQDEFVLNKIWTVTAGMRTSHLVTKFTLPSNLAETIQQEKIHQHFRSVTGNLGIIIQCRRDLYLNFNLGRAFRAPNLSDMSKLGESKGNTYEIPNTSLKPEKIISMDAGIKLTTERFKANGSLYYSRIADLLASAETTYNGLPFIEMNGTSYKVKTKKNIGNAFIRGLELFLDWNILPSLSLLSNFSATYGQNITAVEPIGGIPPLFGLVGLKWQSDPGFVYLYMRFASKQDRLSADDMDDPRIPEGGTPGWHTLNIRAGTTRKSWIYVQCAVENILDINYREHGSGINGPGRNFIVTFEFRKS